MLGQNRYLVLHFILTTLNSPLSRVTMYMFSSQLTLADFNENCDFQEAYDEDRWKGTLVSSLHSILKQVHNSLDINTDALYYTEKLILKLLNMLCSKPLPLTTTDIQGKIKKYFPNPISEWSFNEAKQALEKGKKKSSIVMSIERVQTILQKEFYHRKVDTNMVLYYAAVLDYIAADLLKLVGNYVKNIRKVDISIQDVDVAMYADRALLELFFQEDDEPLYLETQIPQTNGVLTYEQVVNDFVAEERLFIRELKLILKIFYEELNKITPLKEIKEVHSLFEIIEEIYNLTVCLLGAVEDISEMSSDDHCIGSCFEEFAEDAEFDVYEKLLHNIINQKSIEVLSTHATEPSVLNTLQFAGYGFKECVKYYLPNLLMSPLYHCNLYFEYIKIFHSLTDSEKDKECLEQAQGLLAPLHMALSKISLEKNGKNACVRNYNRVKHLQSLEKIHELKKNVDGVDLRDLRPYLEEFYREDTLMKYDSKSNRLTERKVYFFDGVLILCKSNKKISVTVPINVVSSQYEYKCKEMYFLRKVEINDLENTEEIKNAFEIAPRDQPSITIVTKSPEDKKSWFSDLIMVNTRSMLERTLDSIILDEEKKHPLRMPDPACYNFSEPDSCENIILEEKQNTNMPLIKGATLHKLIERLTYHIYADPAFIGTFLTTYRSFSTPSELLDLLIDRFNVPDPSKVFEKNNDDVDDNILREDIIRYKKEFCQPVQFRVLNVFRQWVQHHFYDFQRDQTLLEKLKPFLLNKITGKSLRKWADSVLNLIERRELDLEKEITFAFNNSPPPVEVHGPINSFEEFNILNAHPVEIARQLTLLEFDYFRAVKPSELVGSVWTKKNKAEHSPNLIKIMKHTTNFTRWLEKIIVEAENFEERLAIITRIIEMMVVLQKLNNFNGVLAVTSAMGSAAVYRLRFTFQALPTRLQKILEDARELNGDHFKKYQEKLRNINPPCIPFFGMYLTNILHIEEGNPDYLPESKLINFTKRRKVAEIISEIQQYQNEPYCLNIVPVYREFFENLSPFEGIDDNEMCNILFEQSLLIEPRHATHVPKFPRKWPQISLKSPLAKVKKTRILSELPGFHMEESPQSEADEPATPITPSNHMGSNSDFSIFAPIIIGNPENTCTSFEDLSSASQCTRNGRSASTSKLPPPLPPVTLPPPPLPPRSRDTRSSLVEPPPRDFQAIPPPLPPRYAEDPNHPALPPRYAEDPNHPALPPRYAEDPNHPALPPRYAEDPNHPALPPRYAEDPNHPALPPRYAEDPNHPARRRRKTNVL